MLGFSQIGAESEWRTANTESIKSAAATMNIDLRFADAQQKQENQIKALRSFIAQKVDVIAFSPVVETGWDTVLHEAKAAEHSRDPHRPRGHAPIRRCTSASSVRTSSKKAARPGRWVVERFKDATERREHRRAAGHGGLGAGDRPQEGLRGNHHGRSALQDHPLADPATSRAPRARK